MDLTILRELSSDARNSNKELAGRVGLAPSTCSGRVGALRSRGIIRGFTRTSTSKRSEGRVTGGGTVGRRHFRRIRLPGERTMPSN
ncbi:Lrp/AsnC family transcriptional regulator [Brevibacterium marinum]|uniref:Lrp/AsnC family transcriptional regulator n=1 Tax=Brevibacterium marinum TaxID=418643 RepID=UPI003158372C